MSFCVCLFVDIKFEIIHIRKYFMSTTKKHHKSESPKMSLQHKQFMYTWLLCWSNLYPQTDECTFIKLEIFTFAVRWISKEWNEQTRKERGGETEMDEGCKFFLGWMVWEGKRKETAWKNYLHNCRSVEMEEIYKYI